MEQDWTASFSIRFRNSTCIIILDKKYNIANSSCHFESYGSIWTGPSPKKYYMGRSFWGPYNIFLVTYRFIYCHMTLSAMNYLLYMACNKEHAKINMAIIKGSTFILRQAMNSVEDIYCLGTSIWYVCLFDIRREIIKYLQTNGLLNLSISCVDKRKYTGALKNYARRQWT